MTDFQKLVEQFAKSEALKGMEPWLSGNDVWLPEWQDFNTEYRTERVGECIARMPKVYEEAYGQKLQSNMGLLKTRLREEYESERLAGFDQSFSATKAADWVSIMVDAVLNWAGQSIEGPLGQHVGGAEFTRFAVVVRDFYKRFTEAYEEIREKVRNELHVKTEPPPLITFSPMRVWGPHTINVDKMSELIGARVGVVSLPSVFAKVPLLWAPLAHEVCGHDVPRPLVRRTATDMARAPADPGRLIPEMIEDLRKIITTNDGISAAWRPTWGIWTEELAADLAGLLGMGPYFAIGFAAFMSAAACSDPFGPPWAPGLVGTTLVARGGRAYDEHPPDLLRLYALLGAAEAVLKLGNFDERSVEALKTVVKAAHPPSCTIDVYDFDSQSVLMRYDCDGLIRDARTIGSLMITEQLKSLAGNRIVRFYSWNEEDHNKAQEVATLSNALLPRKDIEAPHLLAGATQAAYDDPARFQEANDFLNAALLRRATKNTAYKF